MPMRPIRHPASRAVFVGVGVMLGAVLAGCGDETAAPAAVSSDADSLSELPSTPPAVTTLPVTTLPSTDDVNDDFADGSMLLVLADSVDDGRVFVLPEDLPDDFYDDLPDDNYDDITTVPDGAFTGAATVHEPIDWSSVIAEAGADVDLAALIPNVDDIGAYWTFDDIDVVESGPRDPDVASPACRVQPPPPLDGIDVQFDRGAEASFDLWVRRADPGALDTFVGAFDGLFDCPAESLPHFHLLERLDVVVPESVVFAGRAEWNTVGETGREPTFVRDVVFLLVRNDPYLAVVSVDVAQLVDDTPQLVTAEEAVRLAWLVDGLL